MADITHTKTGNCFLKAYECRACGKGNYCDVCHKHECPRGDCEECDKCLACQAADESAEDGVFP
jgi:hypothetical protein